MQELTRDNPPVRAGRRACLYGPCADNVEESVRRVLDVLHDLPTYPSTKWGTDQGCDFGR
jgi:hypothetical protein